MTGLKVSENIMSESFFTTVLTYHEQILIPSANNIDNATDTAQAPPATGHERAVTAPAMVVDPPTHGRGRT